MAEKKNLCSSFCRNRPYKSSRGLWRALLRAYPVFPSFLTMYLPTSVAAHRAIQCTITSSLCIAICAVCFLNLVLQAQNGLSYNFANLFHRPVRLALSLWWVFKYHPSSMQHPNCRPQRHDRWVPAALADHGMIAAPGCPHVLSSSTILGGSPLPWGVATPRKQKSLI